MDAQTLAIYGALALVFAIFLSASRAILAGLQSVLLVGGAVALLAAGFMVVTA